DLRSSANQTCWPAQAQVEEAVTNAIRSYGRPVRRGHPYDPVQKHGFIHSQRHGIEVFRHIPPEAPLVVVEAVWQYSHHVLPGLTTHRGPILTVANWSGQWPGLVGMLNLNASMAKAGVKYSTLWSADFKDDYFLQGLRRWLNGEPVIHDASHVRPLASSLLPPPADALGRELGRQFKRDKAIMGVFDEGCMGMYNAIIPDDQILDQCRMYIAALRMADEFGCDAIGIQYQQGLKDICPASDLAEGLLNNVDRPPAMAANSPRVLFQNLALPHFNEVVECAGLDALITNRVWRHLGFAPETTLHDVRYGEFLPVNGKQEFVWVFEISGSVPPNHFANGYEDAV